MDKWIGQYQVVSLLGEGGMGAVYRARDPRFDRDVAIKVLHEQFQRDAGVVERVKSEAVIQAKLNHPHVVSVLDDLIREAGGPLPLERVKRLMDQVLSAMAYAHAQGLVHRDIKPSNILVQRLEHQEYAKVTDFGIARILGSEKVRTATGAKMGTLAYMSPEHVQSPKGVDARSDIYSLGVVLHEMLAGRAPFDADSEYALMRMIVEAAPASLARGMASAEGAELGAVADKALAKAAAARYQSCEEMRAALCVWGHSAPAPRTTATPAAPRPKGRVGIGVGAVPVPGVAPPGPGTHAVPLRSPSSPTSVKARSRWEVAVLLSAGLGLAGLAFFVARPRDAAPAGGAEAVRTLALDPEVVTPATYLRVVGLGPDGVLELRAEPNPNSWVVGQIPSDSAQFVSSGRKVVREGGRDVNWFLVLHTESADGRAAATGPSIEANSRRRRET